MHKYPHGFLKIKGYCTWHEHWTSPKGGRRYRCFKSWWWKRRKPILSMTKGVLSKEGTLPTSSGNVMLSVGSRSVITQSSPAYTRSTRISHSCNIVEHQYSYKGLARNESFELGLNEHHEVSPLLSCAPSHLRITLSERLFTIQHSIKPNSTN